MRKSIVSKAFSSLAMMLTAVFALVIATELFALHQVKRELITEEGQRLKVAFPSFLKLYEEKLGNILNSYGMWTELYLHAKQKDTEWIKNMMNEDYMITSQFDSYGVYDENGVPIYVNRAIFKPNFVKDIVSLLKKRFKIGQTAQPVYFFHAFGDRVYLVGILPLSDDYGFVRSRGFVYFAEEINEGWVSKVSNILSAIAIFLKDHTPLESNSKILCAYRLKDLNGKQIGEIVFLPSKSLILLFESLNTALYISTFFMLLLYLAAFYFLYLTVKRDLEKTFSIVTEVLSDIAYGNFLSVDKLDRFSRRQDELGQLAKDIKTIAYQLSVSLTTDPLTNLYNRLFFEKKLREEIDRARRFKHKLSVAMLDIDDFKRINDTYGHLVGDMVLKRLADIIKSSIRSVDVPSRIGGEEFAIIFPETSAEEAARVVERLRKLIEESYISIPEHTIKFTVSCGVAELEEGDTPEKLLDKADKALYEAKRSGKNKVVIFEGDAGET